MRPPDERAASLSLPSSRRRAERGLVVVKGLRTTRCGRQGHPEFRFNVDTAIVVEADVNWFLEWLEDTVARGTRFANGQTCQVGWVVTQIRQGEGGDLSIWEPDMCHLPVEWSESLSRTLAHLRLQKDVVGSVLPLGELAFPSMRQSAIVCTRLRGADDLILERSTPAGADSGWFCGCRQDNHDHNDPTELRRVSLYEAAVKHAPRIVPYLALPSGVLVEVAGGLPVVFREGKALNFQPGSYLVAQRSNH